MRKPFKSQNGLTLIQVILGITLISAATLGLIYVGNNALGTSRVAAEAETLKMFAQKAESVYSGVQTYAGVTTETALRDNLLPEMRQTEDGYLSSWRAPIRVEPVDVMGTANAGLAIVYEAVPQSWCSKLVSAGSQGFMDIRIDGTSIMTATGTPDLAQAAGRCSAASETEVAFVYSGKLALARAVVGTPPTPVVVPGGVAPPGPGAGPVPVAPTPIGLTPPGIPLAVVPVLPGATYDPGFVTLPPLVVDPICVNPTDPGCVQAPGTTPPPCVGFHCVIPPPCVRPARDTRILNCPAGQFGQINQFRDWQCPDPYGTPVPDPWNTSSDSCIACLPDESDSRNVACPAGTGGGSVIEGRDRSFDCAASNAARTAVWGPWSAWYEVSSTCDPACSAYTSTRSTTPCGGGQCGTIVEQQSVTCPGSGFGAPILGPWVETSNTCGPCTGTVSSTCAARGAADDQTVGGAGSFSGTVDNVTGITTWNTQTGCCVPGVSSATGSVIDGVAGVPGCIQSRTATCASVGGADAGAPGSGSFSGFVDAAAGSSPNWTGQSGCCRPGQPNSTIGTLAGVSGVPGCDPGSSCQTAFPCIPDGQAIAILADCPSGEYLINSADAFGPPQNGTPGLDCDVAGTGALNQALCAPNASCGSSCPPAQTLAPNTRWVNDSRACPAGWSGTETFEREETQSVTRVFGPPPACPGTDSTGAWTSTGNIRNLNQAGCTRACTRPCNSQGGFTASGAGEFTGTETLPTAGTCALTGHTGCCVPAQPLTSSFPGPTGTFTVNGCGVTSNRVGGPCGSAGLLGVFGASGGSSGVSNGTVTTWDTQQGCCDAVQPSTSSRILGPIQSPAPPFGFSNVVAGCNAGCSNIAPDVQGTGVFNLSTNAITSGSCCVAGQPSTSSFTRNGVAGIPGCDAPTCRYQVLACISANASSVNSVAALENKYVNTQSGIFESGSAQECITGNAGSGSYFRSSAVPHYFSLAVRDTVSGTTSFASGIAGHPTTGQTITANGVSATSPPEFAIGSPAGIVPITGADICPGYTASSSCPVPIPPVSELTGSWSSGQLLSPGSYSGHYDTALRVSSCDIPRMNTCHPAIPANLSGANAGFTAFSTVASQFFTDFINPADTFIAQPTASITSQRPTCACKPGENYAIQPEESWCYSRMGVQTCAILYRCL